MGQITSVNFFTLDGRIEKREQFLKEPALEKENSFSKKLGQGKDKAATENMELGR